MEITPAILKAVLEEEYGDDIIKEDNEWIIPSFVKSHKRKLYVNVEKGTAIDFIGGQGYSARQLIAEITNIQDRDRLDDWVMDFVMRKMRHMGMGQIFDHSHHKKETGPPPPIETLPLPKECISPLGKSLTAQRAKSYLHKRGIYDKDIERFHLKFAPSGHYKDRIIIPFVENNEVVWFQARAIFDHMDRYDNPAGVERNMIVYNIDALDRLAVIVEGPFDAMTVNGQAIMGPRLSDWQAMKILAKNPEKIILVPDDDWVKNEKDPHSPGYRGAAKSIQVLLENNFPMNKILVAKVEGGKDLNAIGKNEAYRVIGNARPLNMQTWVDFIERNAYNEYIEKRL